MKTTYYKGIAIKKVGTYNCEYQVALSGLLCTFFSKASAKEAINEYFNRTKYSVFKSVIENIVSAYYDLTDNENFKDGYEFVCFASTAKEAKIIVNKLCD